MRKIRLSVKEKLRSLDPIVFFSSLLISCMSLLTLFGARDVVGIKPLIIQGGAVVLGILCVMLISAMNYEETVERLSLVFFIVSIVLLLTVLVFGSAEGSNKAYLRIPGIPIGIQPSEFVKLFLIISFSRHLDLVHDNINKIKNVLMLALHAGIITGLVLAEGDLGSALVYFFFLCVMLFTAGLSAWYFAGVGLAILAASPFLWEHLKEYQKIRILVGFNPELVPLDIGYQPLMSRSAIAAGGMFGRGLFGGSVYKLVPFCYTDFIFCIVGEKFGMVGILFLFALLVALIVRILILAARSNRRYGSYICVGIAAVLIAQAVENVGMCMACLPVIGITLPLMSYGGSSVLSTYLMLGVVQSIASSQRKKF